MDICMSKYETGDHKGTALIAGSLRRSTKAISRSTPKRTISTASSRRLAGDRARHRPVRGLSMSPSLTAVLIFICIRPPQLVYRHLVLAKLKRPSSPAVLKIGHNFKYDWVLFHRVAKSSRRWTTHLNSKTSMRAGASATVWKSWRSRGFPQTNVSRSSSSAGPYLKYNFRQDRLGRPRNMPARMPISACGCGFG